jgi:hypothetical protein
MSGDNCMLETLSLIGNTIANRRNITWGVGGSLLLHFHNLINDPNDIDLLVDERDASHIEAVLIPLGETRKAIRQSPFCSTHFTKYCIHNIDIDVIGGFSIEHNNGVFKLLFNEDSVVEHIEVNGIEVPLCSLEDWYVLYNLMQNKQDKVIIIENYLKLNGIKHPHLLERALKEPLPFEVRERVEKLLN